MSDLGLRLRYILLQLLVLAAAAVIIGRMWNLQVVSSAQYQKSADENRFRLVPIDAPRGIIYDRQGRQLVKNVPSFTVSVVPGGLPDACEQPDQRRRVLSRVGALLDMEVGDPPPCTTATPTPTGDAFNPSIEYLVYTRAIGPWTPVRIASNVDRHAAFVIEEEHLDLPGVVVDVKALRTYTEGPLLAHTVGFMGRISVDALPDYEARGYLPDDLVGLSGIERTQEETLRGVRGEKHVEVDAFEREVRLIASEPPVAGENVFLTIDLELQRAVEAALREGMRQANSKVGVAIVMDPRTGAILAMVSLPSYDDNLFSGGISQEDFDALNNDPRHPMLNQAVGGQFPPGSTYKIVTASGALQAGVISRYTTLTCEGTFYIMRDDAPDDRAKADPFPCWRTQGHGAINVVRAIAESCNIFMGKVAGGYKGFQGLGPERLAQYAGEFGYGEPTGIELSGEAPGKLPSGKLTGDVYNAAIGQGDVWATPLQVLDAAAVIANRGTLYRPQLVYQVTNAAGEVVRGLQPEVIREVAVSPENLDLVRRGMHEAVTPQGTAYLLHLPELDIAGKTGTAEDPVLQEGEGREILDKLGHPQTHAWFVAFAPFDDPEVALVVFLKRGGEGARTAVPVAETILRYFFNIPVPQPAPTPTRAAATQ